MVEVGKQYIFTHCENGASEWNGKIVTIEPGTFTAYNGDGPDEIFYNAIREDGLRGWVLEQELIG